MADAKTDEAKWAALAAPFKDDEIELLPKYTGKKGPDGKPPKDSYQKCAECGGYHPFPCVHLSYVGHAGITMRLNEVVGPDGWDLRPLALTEQGTPRMSDGGMWAELTILGVTKLGFGDSQGKTGPNATKELIGDALRNVSMRFGIGTYLWSKSDKAKAELQRQGVDDDEPAAKPAAQEAAIGSDAKIIKAIHGKKNALGMSDDTLHAAMKRDYGKEHAGDLTMPEAKELCDKMQAAIEKKEAAEKAEITAQELLQAQSEEPMDLSGDSIPF